MKLWIVMALLCLIAGVVLALGGCSAATTMDKTQVTLEKPKTEKTLLDDFEVSGVGITEINATKDTLGVKACTQPASRVKFSVGKIGSNKHDEGTSTALTESDYSGFRGFSFFGLSPNQVAAMRQAQRISSDEFDVWGTKMEGYGLFERAWDWLKSVFWMLALGAIVAAIALGVLWFIPATRPIATTILTWISSIFPVIGTVVAWLVKHSQVQQAQAQTQEIINGGEIFKEKLAAEPKPADVPADVISKARVLELFTAAQKEAQAPSTQAAVKAAIA
ncbi:MAG: hypothetical protein HZA50_14750 [Planctomycetes bacterium]|nr:hypothetical protein [Planctomycetota bacterium]